VRTIGKGKDVVEPRLTAAAINRPLALLRHLLRLAHEEWGELDVVPKIRTEKEPHGRLRWLTQEEATRCSPPAREVGMPHWPISWSSLCSLASAGARPSVSGGTV
jgi:hypothetical protein